MPFARTLPSAAEQKSRGYLGAFAAALALRAVYLVQAVSTNELFTYPVVDEAAYLRWARDILAGHWLWQEAINYTPGYPLWLAGWLAVLGAHPIAHFSVFLLLGSLQAVIIGRTAELIWSRRVGLVTAWFAALYWPLIVFEASYFAEPLAIVTLSIALYLIVRWSGERSGVRLLGWAGFCLGWSILARANAILCVPIVAAWVGWQAARENSRLLWKRAAGAMLAVALPIVALTAPVALWNWKITGRAMLRTDGWLSMYAGNDPALRAHAVPVGVRWWDFVYRPVRAGFTEPNAKESFWRDEVFRVIREDPGAWLRLMGRKTLLLLGQSEVSQEIDIARFRSASSVLSLPVWPGWGFLAPLAACALVSMLRSPDARRGGLLALVALAYFASIAPVQAAGRYRLPTVVPLLPLAAWALLAFYDSARRSDRRSFAILCTTLAAAAAVIWPDWVGISREKLVNHGFLLGLKRADEHDWNGAYAAFAEGAAWDPTDPDCPLRMGHIALQNHRVDEAEALYHRTLAIFPPAFDALIGLGECALQRERADEALKRAGEALKLAPNNLDALDVACRAQELRGDWRAAAAGYRQMRTYAHYPAATVFKEAKAWDLAGRADEELALYDFLAQSTEFPQSDRDRAAFLGGALAWRLTLDSAQSVARWKLLEGHAGFFAALAPVLAGKLPAAELAQALPPDLPGESAAYVQYALALDSWRHRQPGPTREHLEAVIRIRQADALAERARTILEIWALHDVKLIPPGPAAAPVVH